MAPIPAIIGLGFSKQAVLGHQQWGCMWFFSSSSFSSRYVHSQVSRRQTDTGDTSARLPCYFRSGDLYTSRVQQIPVRADERRVSARLQRRSHRKDFCLGRPPSLAELSDAGFCDTQECVGVHSDGAEMWRDALGGMGLCPPLAATKAASILNAGEQPVLKRMRSRTAC